MMYLKAFLVGGLFCAVGQLFIDRTKLTPARILVGFVVAGVALSAAGIYEPLVEFAGAGATVPLCGFGHALAQGVRAAVADRGLWGAFSGGLSGSAALLHLVLAVENEQDDQSAQNRGNKYHDQQQRYREAFALRLFSLFIRRGGGKGRICYC